MTQRRSRVQGARRLQRLLKRLPEEMTAEVRGAIGEAIQGLHAATLPKIPAPGTHPYSTGLLRGALKKSLTNKGLVGRVGWWGKAYRKAPHARMVEFGTAAGTRKAKDGSEYHHPGTPAVPMLIASNAELRPRYLPRIRKTIAKALERAANHAGPFE